MADGVKSKHEISTRSINVGIKNGIASQKNYLDIEVPKKV